MYARSLHRLADASLTAANASSALMISHRQCMSLHVQVSRSLWGKEPHIAACLMRTWLGAQWSFQSKQSAIHSRASSLAKTSATKQSAFVDLVVQHLSLLIKLASSLSSNITLQLKCLLIITVDLPFLSGSRLVGSLLRIVHKHSTGIVSSFLTATDS